MSALNVNAIDKESGSTLTLGGSGTTVQPHASATVSGFGKILQVVSATLDTETRTTSTSFVTSGLTATLTPASTSNKVLIFCNGGSMLTGSWSESTTTALYSSIGGATAAEIDVFEKMVFGTSATGEGGAHSISYLYSPNTTSSVAITPYFKGGGANQYFTEAGFTVSLILMEIEG